MDEIIKPILLALALVFCTIWFTHWMVTAGHDAPCGAKQIIQSGVVGSEEELNWYLRNGYVIKKRPTDSNHHWVVERKCRD